MNSIVESNLKRAAVRRARWRILQYLTTLGGIVCLLFLLLGVAVVRGWVIHYRIATLAAAAIIVPTVPVAIALLVLAARSGGRGRLAASLEQINPTLRDRLNTLVYLDTNRERDWHRSYYRRIDQQIHNLFLLSPPRLSASLYRPVVHLVGFIALLWGTLTFYERFQPWSRLQFNERPTRVQSAKPASAELALPPENTAEQKRNWGEVRINEPGHDLRVTKVDAVPLLIEVATDQSLSNVQWQTALNGGQELPHELPSPAEPRYAVYQPVLYMDELRLADWDVLTYYARATTVENGSYASDVYFLEVRPFREYILKLPGGEGGKAGHLLGELTDLIGRQQRVVRETHHYAQAPARDPQDASKLGPAEMDLAEASRHLYARLSSELENKPIGDVLDHLGQAESWLKQAGGSLQSDQLPEGQSQERTALTELVATRKQFQKFVSDHGDAFSEQSKEDESTPIAESAGKLKQIEEFRNEAQATKDFVQKTLESQQALARRAAAVSAANRLRLAEQQEDLRKRLEEFQQQHPQPFQDVTNETSQAQAAMKAAGAVLSNGTQNARHALGAAADSLEKLQQALQDQELGHTLTDAYKLKKLLEEQIGQFGEIEQNPRSLTPEQVRQVVANARGTTGQLKRLADQESTRGTFGQPLRQALDGERKRALDSQLDTLEQAHGTEATKQAAGNAKTGLGAVNKAFEESEPSVVKELHKADPLHDNSQNALERGLDQLRSLLTHLENHHPIPPEDEAKLREEALQNLSDGVLGLEGHSEHSDKLLLLLDQELKGKIISLDGPVIKKLMDEIRDFSIEVDDARARKNQEPVVTYIDPTRLPPAYRGRIEKYFKKLSEQ